MSHEQLEHSLKHLAQTGQLIARDSSRQVWGFELAGKPYRVHFYPRSGSILRRFSGNPALRELRAFQQLQKAGVPSPRAISAMVGFRLGDKVGDALLVEACEPSRSLEQLLDDRDRSINRIDLRRQLIAILRQLARAGLGHSQLGLDAFVVVGDQLYLVDARGVRGGGLRFSQLQRLAHSASPFATRGDLHAVWRGVGPDRPLPRLNTISNRIWRRFTRTLFRNGAHFERFKSGGWSGIITRSAPRTASWASASRQVISAEAWRTAWPALLSAIKSDQLKIIKRGDSGDVLAAEISLGDKPFSVIVKKPRRKFWWRYFTELGRGSRARRTWIKTWKMLARDIPTEWPMLLMERRVFGYPVESLLVFERVPGATLASVDLPALPLSAREMLFRRAGRILRRIEDLGFTHTDAKSTNWIVFDDPQDGARPILVDVDGVRHYRWSMMGIERLLRAMKQHPQYTPEDSLALCQGFAPRAKFAREEAT